MLAFLKTISLPLRNWSDEEFWAISIENGPFPNKIKLNRKRDLPANPMMRFGKRYTLCKVKIWFIKYGFYKG
jgi:hypothetical protein